LSTTSFGDADATFDNFRAEDLATGGPGDFNANGTVDTGDYVLWRKLNGPANPYTLWRSNFGNPPGSGSGIGIGGEVPEPTAVALAVMGMAGSCFARRRRYQHHEESAA
jgi:hypothetical protein